MNKIRKIFVSTDFSPCSQEALDYAVFLAKQVDATILLTHILEPTGYPIDFALIEYSEYEQMKAGRALDHIANPLRKKGVKIETHLFKGDPTFQIVKEAKNLECDLIVMGTHGRTGLSHLMMGSVAERVVRTSQIPVLTVRQRNRTETEKVSEKVEAAEMNVPGNFGIIF